MKELVHSVWVLGFRLEGFFRAFRGIRVCVLWGVLGV